MVGWRPEAGKEWKFRSLQPPVPDTNILAVQFSSPNFIWVGCGSGLCRIVGKDPAEQVLQLVSNIPGLPSEQWHAMATGKNGDLYLRSETKLWTVIKDELGQVSAALGTPRRTKTGGASEELEFDANAFIIDEDANIVVTRDGWLKRVRELKEPSQTRTREGDEVMHGEEEMLIVKLGDQ